MDETLDFKDELKSMDLDLWPDCNGMEEQVHQCVVCDLVKKKFTSRNSEEQNNIIKAGRPTPYINITVPTKSCVRTFNNKLFERVEWLTGCPHTQKLFCWCCLLFSEERSSWSKTGYTSVSQIYKSVQVHGLNQKHLHAIIMEKTFGKIKAEPTLDSQKNASDTQHNELVRRNRETMKRLIDIVCFLGKQELAFRCQNELSDFTSRGNYVELVKLLCQYDEKLKVFMENDTVFSALSDIIQIALIESVSSIMLRHIINEIEETRFVALSLDETGDVGSCTVLSVVMRYVTKDGDFQERFLGFLNISENRTTNGLYCIVCDLMNKYNCGEKLVAQSYDGAAVMIGHLTSLQNKVRHTFPLGLFVNSSAHGLNHILSQAASQVKECRVFFLTVASIADFFSKSTNRTHTLDMEIRRILPSLLDVPWNYISCIVVRIHNHREKLLNLFKEISSSESDNNWDQESFISAGGIVKAMENFSFRFLLEVFASIFPVTENLNEAVKAKADNIGYCIKKVKEFQKILQDKLEAFEEIWHKVYEEQEPPTKLQKCDDNQDFKTRYEHLYCKILDIIIQQLKERLNNLESQFFLELLSLKNFYKYRVHFPDRALHSLNDTYPGVFNISALRAQLTVIYVSEDSKHKSVTDLLNFIKTNELEKAFSELTKLCELVLTLPVDSAPMVQGSFSKLKNIKNYAHNMHGQNRIALSLIALEKELLTSLQQNKQQLFYDSVIEDFAKVDRRIQLHFK